MDAPRPERIDRHPLMLSLSYDSLAPLDAILNGTAAILLLSGYVAIRRHKVQIHRACMLGAFALSVAFFISYCIYHYHVGDVRFGGQGWIRPVYFSILISHVTLAFVIVPLVLITLGRALRGNFARHRRIARWAWPIWMYVSVTGVVVYLMLYLLYPHLPPAAAATGASVPSATVAAATR
jgi:putative membrane protein